ncbi:hypothetical protein BDY17DRAFT_320352 [Neohortaea acidophila]|uniref:Pentacotripeptide-repeat region of PRORP domain-containing protein n=1 Tax=Neohortaea acidophila TaxID=245834 RepID=A0A6A6Q733_9PEZI|nr:uncharacterized protein BDY17DRAFT_320352 [Neohortaea acidophila]KAF2487839.1 hypothetical protein BDY17DRAFT_320352 [Neohortaea acidophila]
MRNLQRELTHLPDRIKLAEHVHYVLRCNQPEKALNLCRLASKEQNVVVSWNHCVDWHMQRGKVDEAITIYNEMKKRAQFPDSYTYSLLLRGLARPQRHGQAVAQSNVNKAVSIYNSLSSPTSRVRPSILHTNAVLQVCSAARNTDALWGIVAKLPKGDGGPDQITYTTILNAIRLGAFGKNETHITEDQLGARRAQAVREGRAVWKEIVKQWRRARIEVDSGLVHCMGALLLISRRLSDWDQVLDLVQQTTGIERLVPPLGHPERHAGHVPEDRRPSVAEENQEDVELTDFRPFADAEVDAEGDGYEDAPATKVFQPIKPLQAQSGRAVKPMALPWVKPDNMLLSLIVEACTALRIPKTAMAYWNLFVSEHEVKPDLNNFHNLLKLMSFNRSSAQAAALLKEGMAAAGVAPKNQTFRLAMGVCARDHKNYSVLTHARAIIDVMEQTQADLDIHTLVQYLNLALTSDDGAKLAAALNRLDPIVHNLRSMMAYGVDSTEERTTPQAYLVVQKEEIVQFFQTMVGAIDTLMNRGLVPREEYKDWHARRSQLTQAIGRAKISIENARTDIDTMVAEQRNRRQAREAGRRQWRDKMERKGQVEQRMSKTEWELKSFRTRKVANENSRVRSVGLRDWTVEQAQKRGHYADSPMELATIYRPTSV